MGVVDCAQDPDYQYGTICQAAAASPALCGVMPYDEGDSIGCWEPGPGLETDTAVLDFYEVLVGDMSQSLPLYPFLAPDTAAGPLEITGLAVEGDFQLLASDCVGILDGDRRDCFMDLAFSPTSAGDRTGSVRIRTTAPTGDLTVSLVGIGATIASGRLYVSPLQSLPEATVGYSSQGYVNFHNLGNSTVTYAVAVASSEFTIVEDYCNGVLRPDEACQLQVAFSPTQEGTRTATVVFTTSHGLVQGQVTGNSVPQVARLSTSSGQMRFGTQVDGSPVTRTLKVQNDGNVPVTIGGINLAPVAGAFTLTSAAPCLGQINVGQSCLLEVVFSPPAKGDHSAVLEIASTAAASPLQVTLSGSWVAPLTTASASAARLMMGRSLVGATTAAKGLVLTNTGPNPLMVEPVADTRFTVSLGDCAAPVAPGGQCTLSLAAIPPDGGLYSLDVAIPLNIAERYLTIRLTGLGERDACR